MKNLSLLQKSVAVLALADLAFFFWYLVLGGYNPKGLLPGLSIGFGIVLWAIFHITVTFSFPIISAIRSPEKKIQKFFSFFIFLLVANILLGYIFVLNLEALLANIFFLLGYFLIYGFVYFVAVKLRL